MPQILLARCVVGSSSSLHCSLLLGEGALHVCLEPFDLLLQRRTCVTCLLSCGSWCSCQAKCKQWLGPAPPHLEQQAVAVSFKTARDVPTTMSHLHRKALGPQCLQAPLQLYSRRSWLPEGLNLPLGALQLHPEPFLRFTPPHPVHLPLKPAGFVITHR